MSYENFKPEDLFISSYDAHGGGWSPRVPAGIVVVHLPTGTVVKCHEHRSQHRNRHDALTALWDAVQGKQSYSVLAGQVKELMKALEYADNKLYILTHNRTRSDISPRLLVDADKAYKVVGDTLKKFKQTAGDNNGTN